MAIGINDLDYDYEELQSLETTLESSQVEQPSDQNDDFVVDFLKTRGIDDPSKIKFENDEGQIEERDWNDLSKEEKFNILNTPLETPTQYQQDDNDLSDQEISLLNYLRLNNLTPEEFISQMLGEQPSQEPIYRVDDFSDDELYLLDLESRVGEMSEDEEALALAIAKQNEEFFKKQVDGIRKEYKEREDLKSQQDQLALEQLQQELYNEYSNNVIDAINNLNAVGELDLDLEDNDKELLAQFMLSQDENGQNPLYVALQDPETLTKAAWFILNGEEAFNSITDYFTNLIKLISENQYKKGLEEGQKKSGNKPTLVINNNKNNDNKTSYQQVESLDQLDYE